MFGIFVSLSLYFHASAFVYICGMLWAKLRCWEIGLPLTYDIISMYHAHSVPSMNNAQGKPWVLVFCNIALLSGVVSETMPIATGLMPLVYAVYDHASVRLTFSLAIYLGISV